MHSMHSEPLTVPFSKGIQDSGLKEFTWKLSLPEREHEVYLALLKCGFSDFETPIEYNGVEVEPGKYLEKVINRNIEKNGHKSPNQESYRIHFAIATGIRNNEKIEVTCTVIESPISLYNGYHDAAASMNVSIGAQLINKSKRTPGVWAPEEYFKIDKYFSDLRKRKFTISTETKKI